MLKFQVVKNLQKLLVKQKARLNEEWSMGVASVAIVNLGIFFIYVVTVGDELSCQ